MPYSGKGKNREHVYMFPEIRIKLSNIFFQSTLARRNNYTRGFSVMSTERLIIKYIEKIYCN